MTLATEERALLLQLLRPRVQTLADLLDAQVATLPPGDDSWTDTAERLAVARGALVKLQEVGHA